MTGHEIADLRRKLGLTQVQLAQLLGVHPLTVSKWERGLMSPPPHHNAMLESFKKARQSQSDIGEAVSGLLLSAGVVVAIYALLRAAFGEE